MLIYHYPQLYPGKLVKRYKRFLADIELDTGELITAHCPNTGPMTGVCQIGAPVLVSYHDNPKRKLKYTWEAIEVESTNPNVTTRVWVGINTALPNRLIKTALEQHLFPELPDYQTVRSEVVYGKDNRSRVDFVLSGKHGLTYLEVKNTTWSIDDVAIFPDTETTRGQKHLEELTDILMDPSHNHRAVMLYVINRSDLAKFSPGDITDPRYSQLLRTAVAQGLQVLPYRFEVTPEGVSYLGIAETILSMS